MLFRNRRDAGRQLAQRLQPYRAYRDGLVLALPRGGVPVAYEVAKALQLPLDVFLVRKLGVPGHEELAMGAIASGGSRLLNQDTVAWLRITPAEIEAVTQQETRELERRERLFRAGSPEPELAGKTILLIDDGLATGATMKVAAQALRKLGPARIVAAVPVASAEACQELRQEVDEVVCAAIPASFLAVGQWYADFTQTSDEEVRSLLQQIRSGPSQPLKGR